MSRYFDRWRNRFRFFALLAPEGCGFEEYHWLGFEFIPIEGIDSDGSAKAMIFEGEGVSCDSDF